MAKRLGKRERRQALFFSHLNEVDYCAICGRKPPAVRRLCVDHDHDTGRARGILCDQCNFAVGWIEYLRKNRLTKKAVTYLKKYS